MKSKKKLKNFLLKLLKEIRETHNNEVELVPKKWSLYLPISKKVNTSISIDNFIKSTKLLEQITRMQSLISENRQINNEMAMKIDDPDYEIPHPSVRKGIEGEKNTPFTNSDFFGGGDPNYTTLEKIGSEEFNKIIRDVKPFGKMKTAEFMQVFKLMASLENPHRAVLGQLAIRKVTEQFGLPENVAEKLEARLVNDIEKPNEDSNNLVQDIEEELDFTDEEKEIIRQHVEKRKLQNLLMMGAGFRSHSTFNSIKEDLDKIDPKLYPLYEKTMPNIALFMWKTPLEDMMGGVSMMGLSKLKKDENDNVKAEAQATIFPILLHETAKVAIELLFAHYLISLTDRFGKNVASEIIKQADVFEEEIWMKRIGPTLWKKLHDVIDYIVKHDRGGDYTIVAHLLHKISLMEPYDFIEFLENVVYDGEKTLVTLNTMIDEIEGRIEAYQNQEKEVPQPEDIEPGEEINASAIQSELEQLAMGAKEKQANTPSSPAAKLSYAEMSLEQLQAELKRAIGDERYEDAAKIVPEINKKKDQV